MKDFRRSKGLLLVLAAVTLLFVAGCGLNAEYELYHEEESITRIRLIEVPSEDYRGTTENELLENNLESLAVYGEIEMSEAEEFLASFHSVPCHDYFGEPPGLVMGHGILIDYENGDWEIISRYGGAAYMAEWQMITYKGPEFYKNRFESFWNEYCSEF